MKKTAAQRRIFWRRSFLFREEEQMRSRLKPRPAVFFAYLAIPFLLYTFVVFAPILLAGYYGCFEWPGGSKMKFIGLDNYIKLFSDKEFFRALSNNIYLIVVCVLGQIGFAFLFALILNGRRIRMKGFHRTMSFFPSVLSAVVIGFIWTMIYDYNYGLLNTVLRAVGMEDKVQPWLANEHLALFLVALPLIWQYIGYYLIIITSSMAAIDPQIFEMAEIDGAMGWKKAIYITLPLVKNTLLVCVTLCIAGNMKAFDHIYVMTGGGPGTTTNVMAMYAYNTSFISYKMGYGSAMSIGILVVSLVLVGSIRGIIGKISKEKE